MRKLDLHRAYLYDAGGHVTDSSSKPIRWFVYFMTIDPETGKRVRRRNYGYVNAEPVPIKRTKLLVELQHQQQALLDSGIYEVRHNAYPRYFTSHNIGLLIKQVITEKNAFQTKYAARGHRTHLNGFLDYLIRNHMHNHAPQNIKRSHINDFRNELLKTKQNRTVNNYIADVHAFFNYLYNKIEDYNYKNPCILKKLPTRSESHVIYKTQEVEVMVSWLKANDPYLYLYCKFIAYSFLRVNEIRHMKIRDIDLVNWRITRTGENHKTGKRAYQYIQTIFRSDLEALQLHKYEPDMYLFSSKQQPGYHLLNEKYFCMRFRKYKDLHGFGRNHTMYGLKHTFISQMKRQGATDKELLNITGLVTIEALYKYLKDIGAVEPADMSDKYIVKF